MARSFIATFTDYLKTRTDAPPVFHTHAALCTLATAVGANVWTDGSNEVYPNLSCVLLARSGMGKSVPLNMAATLLRKSGMADRLLPASFSQEALLDQLGRQSTGLFVVQEFAAFMALLGRDYNAGLEETLTELYDVPDEWKRVIKTGLVVLRKPCVSILGASSPDWFAKAFEQKSLRGGWFARFLFCPSNDAGEPVENPGPRAVDIENQLVTHLSQVREVAGHFTVSAGAARQLAAYTRDSRLAARESDDFGGMRARAPILAQKVAMLMRLSRDTTPAPDSLVLSDRDVEQAVTFVRATHTRAEQYLSEEVAHNRKDADRLRIREIVRRYVPNPAPWSDVLRLAHLDATDFKNAVNTAVEGQSLYVWKEGRTQVLSLTPRTSVDSQIHSEPSVNLRMLANGHEMMATGRPL